MGVAVSISGGEEDVLGIRQKLALGFSSLLATIAIVGGLTIRELRDLGQAIDVILRDNYHSVVACQDMKEALERVDSGVLLILAGRPAEGRRYVEEYIPRFRAALAVGQGNITLPGERELADEVASLFEAHVRALPSMMDPSRPLEERTATYFSEVEPRFETIKASVQAILVMNQENMDQASAAARDQSRAAYQAMLTAVVVATALAALFSYFTHRWILKPIRRLTETANDIRRGSLEVVVERSSRDEIGQLAESFNEMATALREVRARDRFNLMRTRQATQEVFKVMPAAIAVLDLEGRVDVATDTAQRHFGLKPGVLAQDLGYAWLPPLIQEALDRDGLIQREAQGERVQQFVDGREHFFEPWAVPIPTGRPPAERTGVCVVMKDVTDVQEQQELKRDAVSTVSHQLKTPLTSLRMSIHLLLEERLGSLNQEQTELLVTARADADRLAGILDDLLDMGRLEAGRAALMPVPQFPQSLMREAIEPFLAEAKDKGITLSAEAPEGLPSVLADPTRIQHVFANLLSNAVRFTHPGGAITLRASQEGDAVRFAIEDTGMGIAPEHLGRLFAPFYRVPGQEQRSGAGLGLAIVAEIVKAHGGRVGVESEPERGSIFCFTLPVSLPGAAHSNGHERT
ncbi:MAG: ATP-binding protein [Planctomycetota bacterium]